MRILVTGAAGFLGSHLCDYLLEKGHSVIGMDNFITGRPENISHLSPNKNFHFIEHDVTRFIEISDHLDGVMHFASPASPNPNSPYGYVNLPIETLKAGSLGTFNTLGVAKANNARFLLASTSEIYGDPLEHPQKETYWGHVDPTGMRSVYDEAKRFSEAVTMAYQRRHQMDTKIVRIFNTYGPRIRKDDGRVISNFIMQALQGEPLTIYGDGSQTRSFCYVSDLIQGIYLLFLSREHMPVNIGNPHEITILQCAQEVNRLIGNPQGVTFQKEKFVGADPQRRKPDITRAKEILGWEPVVGFEEGLTKTIEYFRKNTE